MIFTIGVEEVHLFFRFPDLFLSFSIIHTYDVIIPSAISSESPAKVKSYRLPVRCTGSPSSFRNPGSDSKLLDTAAFT